LSVERQPLPEAGRRQPVPAGPFVAVGITGGIASGKSTVARMFRELGAVGLDADRIAREVVAPGQPALEAIRRRFGPEVFHADGSLDRAALGERVFASAEERRALNAITHPVIIATIKERLARERELANQTARPGVPRRVAVAEIPLLIEENLQGLVDQIIVVSVKPSTQVARLTHGKGLTEDQAWARLRAQLPLDQRLPFAEWVIDGEASIPETEHRVREIWQALTAAPAADRPPDKT
jgi:dephospho-CoA kinase